MLSLSNVHTFAVNAVQAVADGFKWPIGYGRLNDHDVALLKSGAYGSLNWKWALATYGEPLLDASNGVLDVSMKIVDAPEAPLGGVILCQLDLRRTRLNVCMMENFLKHTQSHLSGKVWLSAMIYAHTLAKATKMEEIYILNPTEDNLSRYHRYGFYEDVTCMPHLSASLETVEESIRGAIFALRTSRRT
ncbi:MULTISPECIES: hypothetical protein [Pantoea]|uniref:hypothetical protein n=1 Tax=Pantoea TaxID=53335 RepID=UPI0010A8D503|nr:MULTISPECIES: hypothetical protein [Pantoea]THD31807.1 hypothetical protein ERD80_18735 [Pantoea sp. R102]